MKHFFPVFIGVLMVTSVSAAPELGPSTQVRGDFFYGLDRGLETAQLMVTFNPDRKILLRMKFAKERLAEAQRLKEEKKFSKMNQTLQVYREMVERTRSDQTLSAELFVHAKILDRLGVLPGDRFYSVKRFAEDGAVKHEQEILEKARKQAYSARTRVNETKLLLRQGRYSDANTTLKHYMQELEELRTIKSSAAGENSREINRLVSQATARHQTVFQSLAEDVPMEVETRLNQALQLSQTAEEHSRYPGNNQSSTVVSPKDF